MDLGVSLADALYQDLTEVLRVDRKALFWQGAVQERMGKAAERGKKLVNMGVKKGLNLFKGAKSRKNTDKQKLANRLMSLQTQDSGNHDDDNCLTQSKSDGGDIGNNDGSNDNFEGDTSSSNNTNNIFPQGRWEGQLWLRRRLS